MRRTTYQQDLKKYPSRLESSTVPDGLRIAGRSTSLTPAQRGFTIVELLVALTVFSLVLLLCLVALIQIGRMFYKGISLSRTQEVARSIATDINNDLVLSKGIVEVGTDAGSNLSWYCISGHRYTYELGKKLGTDAAAGVRRDSLVNNSACSPIVSGAAELDTNVYSDQTKEYLSDGMRVNMFDIQNCASGLCTVQVRVLFGEDDLFMSDTTPLPSNPTATDYALVSSQPDARCTGTLSSSQFCATADVSTSVYKRF